MLTHSPLTMLTHCPMVWLKCSQVLYTFVSSHLWHSENKYPALHDKTILSSESCKEAPNRSGTFVARFVKMVSLELLNTGRRKMFQLFWIPLIMSWPFYFTDLPMHTGIKKDYLWILHYRNCSEILTLMHFIDFCQVLYYIMSVKL